ncbi:MAG: PEP-CTERM system histidine kinase PrsK [Methylohalobius sp.]|nr:PEP-CTERM system histidine kinase PrsK [Methylohalobius sp.]
MAAAIAGVSYSVAWLAYLFLSVWIATSWRGRWKGGMLLLASSLTCLWAGVNAWQLTFRSLPAALIWSLEVLRLGGWLIFLGLLLPPRLSHNRWIKYGGAGVIAYLMVQPWLAGLWPGIWPVEAPLIGQLLLALVGLIGVEQLYRNTRPDRRWYIKFLCLALGGMCAYEFYLYSEALLFKRVDVNLWSARGLVVSLLVPLFAVSAARNPDWSVEAFISRDFVFHSAAVLGTGLYLLVMAAVGYYIRFYGGQWGEVFQIAFLVGAGLLLLALLFSGSARAYLRVFLTKHFFSYRYDYRKEWIRITQVLSQSESESTLGERVICALADLVESPAGILWVRAEQGHFLYLAAWGDPKFHAGLIEGHDPVIDFMQRTRWVINLKELAALPELYENLSFPSWLHGCREAWLLVPLFHGETLWAIVLLTSPRARIECNWEVLDILKTAGRQAASFLAVEETARRLLEARQFEGFNRLAAFVVHDLKNLIAQLTLVVRNADKHAANPEFVRDAMATVEHAVNKMNRLLTQLRNIGAETCRQKIDLRVLLNKVLVARAGQLPRPNLECRVDREVWVLAQPDKLGSALEHIIQNAQEAAGRHGWVKVKLDLLGRQAIVEVEDNGPGMDSDFIRQRLFKPFETTKGLSGMGIGAYESREYVRALGGDLTVHSTPGQGSRFCFLLPVAEGQAEVESGIPA